MTSMTYYIRGKRRLFVLTCLLGLLCPVFVNTAYLTSTHAAECKFSVPDGFGNATSVDKAKRNARIDLETNLNRTYPGDSKRYLSEGIEYKCKNSVLWHCIAKANICN